MKALLLFLISSLSCFGQGFSLTGNGFSSFASPRPPNCWVDVRQLLATNAPDSCLVSNLIDFSGHGWRFTDYSAGGTNQRFYTRLGGVFSANSGGSDGYQMVENNAGGSPNPISAQVWIMGRTNEGTIATRMMYRAASGNPQGVAQTGETGSGTPHYIYLQMLSGTIYFDWGSAGDFRCSKAVPGDMANAWVNVFFRRTGTNQSIWMHGPTGTLTNWLVDLTSSVITNAYRPFNINLTTGNFRVMTGNPATNYYTKRTLWWDYALSEHDMNYWSREMTYLDRYTGPPAPPPPCDTMQINPFDTVDNAPSFQSVDYIACSFVTGGSGFTGCKMNVQFYIPAGPPPAGTVKVSIYTDNAGSPGTLVGTASATQDRTVLVDAAKTTFTGISATLSASTTYWAVVNTPATGNGTLSVYEDGGSETSTIKESTDGTTWSTVRANSTLGFEVLSQ